MKWWQQAIATLAAVFLATAAFSNAWTLNGNYYAYRQPLLITNNNATFALPANYTHNATINHAALATASKSLANGDDLRIGCGALELDRRNVTAFNTAETVLEFKLPTTIAASATNNTCYAYYGNNSLTNPPNNWENIYVFGDNIDTLGNFTITTNWATDSSYGWQGNGTRATAAGQLKKTLNAPQIRQRFLVRPHAVSQQYITYETNYFLVGNNWAGWYYYSVPTGYQPYNNSAYAAGTWYMIDFYADFNSSMKHYMWVSTPYVFTAGTYVNLTTGLSLATQPNLNFSAYTNLGTNYFDFDDVNVMLWMQPAPTTTVGAEETAGSLTVSVLAPSNTTYVNNNLTAQFFYSSDANATANCTRYLDAGWFTSSIVANTTVTNDSLSSLAAGSHSYNASCLNTTSWGTQTIYFSVNDYALNEYYDAATNEASAATHYAAVNTTANVDDVEADLIYEGTVYAVTQNKNGLDYSFTKTVYPNLAAVNASNASFTWNYTIRYVNASEYVITVNHNQTILWATYYNSLTASPTVALSGDTVTVYSNVTHSGVAAYNVTHSFNNTVTAAPWYTSGFWVSTATAPTVTTTQQKNVTSQLAIVYGGTTLYRNATNYTVTISPINITVCYAGLPVILNFTTWNEDDVTNNTIADQFITITAWNAARTTNNSFNFSFYDVYYAALCLGTNATVYVDSFHLYNETGFGLRAYFMQNVALDNTTTNNISLYMQTVPPSKNTKIIVKDAYAQPLENAVVSTLRWYPGNNTYLMVAMIKSDANGEALTYLQPNDAWYRFIVTKDLSVLDDFPSRQIICDPVLTQCEIVLQVGEQEGAGEYWQYVNNIAGNCTFNAATNNTYCTFIDSSGLFNEYRMEVWKTGVVTNTQVCNITTTASSGTLSCTLNETGHYIASLYAIGSRYPLSSVDFGLGTIGNLIFANAMILALLLIITIGLSSIHAPATGVIFFVFGVAITYAVGLLAIDFIAVVALIIVAIIVAWKLKV